jgi:cytochrome P450
MVSSGQSYELPTVLERSGYFKNTLVILRDPVSFLGKLPKTHGPIVRADFAGKKYFVLQHPDHIQHVLLNNQKQYCKPGATKLLRFFLGEGLSTSNGELWLGQRRLMQPAFHRQRLSHILNIINEETGFLIRRLQLLPGKTRVNISNEFLQLTIAIISRAMFSSALRDDMSRMVDALDALALFASRWMKSFIKVPLNWPTASNINFRKNCAIFDAVIFRMIEERRKYRTNPGLPAHEDLLDMLLDHAGTGEADSMPEQQLRDEVATMFMAGHETTAQSLGWIFYHLAVDKEIKRKLDEEGIQTVDDGPALEDLARMTYTKQVIREGLRHYPPIWALVRKPYQDDEINGVIIPASSYVLVNIYGMHHHPGFWNTPDYFNPDHFNPGAENQRPAFAYLPFGGGPRLCLGNNFAMMVLQVVASRISRSFEFDIPNGYTPAIETNISLRAKGGIQLIITAKR